MQEFVDSCLWCFDRLRMVACFHSYIGLAAFLNGHDGNIVPIEADARSIKVAHPDLKIITLDTRYGTRRNLLPPDFFYVRHGLGHGGQ
jgi:hypothetical protein